MSVHNQSIPYNYVTSCAATVKLFAQWYARDGVSWKLPCCRHSSRPMVLYIDAKIELQPIAWSSICTLISLGDSLLAFSFNTAPYLSWYHSEAVD